jgi:hypothetical protein
VGRDHVAAGIDSAWAALRQEYAQRGGYLFPGALDGDEGFGYMGPLGWSEGDSQFRFGLFLEREFPGCVHLEMPLRASTRPDLNIAPGPRGVNRIDIVVSDMGDAPEDASEAGRLFRTRVHEAFIEVKWFVKTGPEMEGSGLAAIREICPSGCETTA